MSNACISPEKELPHKSGDACENIETCPAFLIYKLIKFPSNRADVYLKINGILCGMQEQILLKGELK